MMAETAAKEQLISDRTLPFDALETEYKDASESYDLRKKKLVGKSLLHLWSPRYTGISHYYTVFTLHYQHEASGKCTCVICLVAQRYNAGLAIASALVRIPVATVSKFWHLRSLHDAPVHSAV